MDNIFENIDIFLTQITSEISDAGIDVSELKIDHIAFSTKNSFEYEETLTFILNQGSLQKEANISNRRVAVIKLTNPISYKNQDISVVELIEPKASEDAFSGWEHVEFLINDYNSFLKTYPNLNWDLSHMDSDNFSRIKLTLPSKREVKFLDTPILDSLLKERDMNNLNQTIIFNNQPL